MVYFSHCAWSVHAKPKDTCMNSIYCFTDLLSPTGMYKLCHDSNNKQDENLDPNITRKHSEAGSKVGEADQQIGLGIWWLGVTMCMHGITVFLSNITHECFLSVFVYYLNV